MSKLNDVKYKVKESVKDVDFNVVEDNLRIVINTVETINKTNTTSKADNIQRGVEDARKVLSLFGIVRAVLSVFKKK